MWGKRRFLNIKKKKKIVSLYQLLPLDFSMPRRRAGRFTDKLQLGKSLSKTSCPVYRSKVKWVRFPLL